MLRRDFIKTSGAVAGGMLLPFSASVQTIEVFTTLDEGLDYRPEGLGLPARNENPIPHHFESVDHRVFRREQVPVSQFDLEEFDPKPRQIIRIQPIHQERLVWNNVSEACFLMPKDWLIVVKSPLYVHRFDVQYRRSVDSHPQKYHKAFSIQYCNVISATLLYLKVQREPVQVICTQPRSCYRRISFK